jgi:hypothetical protein
VADATRIGAATAGANRLRQSLLTNQIRQDILTIMANIGPINESLDRELRGALARDPLDALVAVDTVQSMLEKLERDAVRAAVQHHSWSEIGAALGVTKQAAHQRFAKPWARQVTEEIKDAIKAQKIARANGRLDEAAVAKARRDALVAEFENANRPRKRRVA